MKMEFTIKEETRYRQYLGQLKMNAGTLLEKIETSTDNSDSMKHIVNIVVHDIIPNVDFLLGSEINAQAKKHASNTKGAMNGISRFWEEYVNWREEGAAPNTIEDYFILLDLIRDLQFDAYIVYAWIAKEESLEYWENWFSLSREKQKTADKNGNNVKWLNKPIASSTENEKSKLGTDLLLNTASPYERREIMRWLIRDNSAADEELIALLRHGLVDPDWEVRMSAIIACVRLRAASLLPEIDKVATPDSDSAGIDAGERSIMRGIKKVAQYLLKGGKIPAGPNRIPVTKEEKVYYLTRCVAGVPAKYYHDMLLLVVALASPVFPNPTHSLPDGIVARGGKLFLKKSRIEMCFVPNYSHFIGSSGLSFHPIQLTENEDGFFISKYPIQEKGFFKTRKGSLKCTFAEAQKICKQLSEKEGLNISIPNATDWEMAARGHNGRVYPWGISYTDDMLEQGSPWGLSHMVGFGGEWTITGTKNGKKVVMGNAKSHRTSQMSTATEGEKFAFRIGLQNRIHCST